MDLLRMETGCRWPGMNAYRYMGQRGNRGVCFNPRLSRQNEKTRQRLDYVAGGNSDTRLTQRSRRRRAVWSTSCQSDSTPDQWSDGSNAVIAPPSPSSINQSASRAHAPQAAHILVGELIWSRVEPYDSPEIPWFMEENRGPILPGPSKRFV
jgi:hypothetical protein